MKLTGYPTSVFDPEISERLIPVAEIAIDLWYDYAVITKKNFGVHKVGSF